MKKLIMALCIMATLLTGCGGYQVISHTINIFGDDNTVYTCGGSDPVLTRPKEFPVALKANVPLQASTINDSGANSATLDKSAVK